MESFTNCLDSGRYAREWQQDRADGESYGVGGTPAIFVNGVPLLGSPPAEALLEIVQEELERIQDGRTPAGPSSR